MDEEPEPLWEDAGEPGNAGEPEWGAKNPKFLPST